MAGGYDTGMDLLNEAATALELAGGACESPEDAERFTALAARMRGYLAVSRSTTTLGMPRIPSTPNKLVVDDGLLHRTAGPQQTHIKVIPN